MTVPVVKFNDGNEIPQIGLGLWQVRDQAEFNTAFEAAAMLAIGILTRRRPMIMSIFSVKPGKRLG